MAAKISRRNIGFLIPAAYVLVAGLAAALLWTVLMPPEAPPPPPPPPSFQAMVIKPGNFLADQVAEATAAGGRVPPNEIDFLAEVVTIPVADVEKQSAGKAFLDLLRAAKVDDATIADSVVLRARDGEPITAEGGDALAGANLSVIVIPRAIMKMFDDERSAFLLIRMRISGLQ